MSSREIDDALAAEALTVALMDAGVSGRGANPRPRVAGGSDFWGDCGWPR